MNNLKFNEGKENNGVVRKRVIDIIQDHKFALKGIVTGIVVMVMVSLTTSGILGSVEGAMAPSTSQPDSSDLVVITTSVTSQITTTNTTSTKQSTTTTSLATTTSKAMTKATTSVVENKTVEIENTVEDNTPVEVDTYNDEPEYTDEYIGYKASTHYVHKNTCRWFDSTCYEITSTEGIEARKCTECNPDIEILTPYVAPEPQTSGGTALDYITELEYIYLCNTVGHEYGSDWVSLYDKACVVAVVMNRVNDGGWSGGRTNNIYNVITAPGQFNPSYATDYYHSCVTQSCKDAVDYYFANQSIFPHYTSFWGDGRTNHFS